jgi:hypothetical protein
MGVVSDKEFDSELTKLDKGQSPREESNSVPKIEGTVVDVTRGRPTGSTSVPNGLRRIIGDESTVNGRQSAVELAQSFGISPSSVSAYGVGATSTASYDERPNSSVINSAHDRISKKARGKLMKALNHITDEKLGMTNARDLSGIVKDMSAVIRNMEPEKEKLPGTGNSGPTFVFYSPQVKKEETFDVVYAKD